MGGDVGGWGAVLLEVLLGVRVLGGHTSSWLGHLSCLAVRKIGGFCGHLAGSSAAWRSRCGCAWQAG